MLTAITAYSITPATVPDSLPPLYIKYRATNTGRRRESGLRGDGVM